MLLSLAKASTPDLRAHLYRVKMSLTSSFRVPEAKADCTHGEQLQMTHIRKVMLLTRLHNGRIISVNALIPAFALIPTRSTT